MKSGAFLDGSCWVGKWVSEQVEVCESTLLHV